MRTIGVFGDYDVDGVTTCALLTRSCATPAALVAVAGGAPRRGLRLRRGEAAGSPPPAAGVIVTGDCGTSDLDGDLRRARARRST